MLKNLKPEQVAALAAKMMLIESVIGTHGLSLELSRLARRLLEEGEKNPKEILARVEDVRNDAGEIDELERHEDELRARLEGVMILLDNKRSALSYSEDLLRWLDGSEQEPVEEALVEFDDELDDDSGAEGSAMVASSVHGSGRY